jgi:ABC-type transporter Mla subunit MlaD
MNPSRRNAVQVGIMGLAALALLLAGVIWIKEYRLGKKKMTYTFRRSSPARAIS